MSQNEVHPVLDDTDEEGDDDSQRNKYLTFRIGKEEYALSIAEVVEIVGILPVTEVPDMPAFVRGVVNLRGRVIPAIDVRLRFCMEPRAYDPRTCVVVVDLKGITAGLIVDTVSEVQTISPGAISNAPVVQQGRQSRFVKGLGRVEDSVKILLDLDKLLLDSDLGAMAGLDQ